MNLTGVRHSVRGSSLRSASGVERSNICGSSNPPWTRLRGVLGLGCVVTAESIVEACISVNFFGQGPERQHGQEGECDQDDGDAGNHPHELGSVRGQCPDGLRRGALFGQRTGQR